MNKSIITIVLLAFLSHSLSFTMNNTPTTIQDVMDHFDIRPQITRQLSQNDFHDTRLVCKAWAPKNRDWYFMLDSVEKKYDKISSSLEKFGNIKKSVIFATLIYKNDLNAVKWILDNSKHCLNPIPIEKTPITFPILAIHNNNRDMAKLLIDMDPDYKDQDWKTVYNTITVDKNLKEYLYTEDNRTFSFLPYILSALTDDVDELQKLYAKKIPTIKGQEYLINYVINNNASECLKFFLQNKKTRDIFNKRRTFYFNNALEHRHKNVLKEIINNGLYDINKKIGDYNETILDNYHYNNRLEKDIETRVLLEELGAKRSFDLPKKEICCCSIQ